MSDTIYQINTNSKHLYRVIKNTETHVHVEKIADWDEDADCYRPVVPSENPADKQRWKVTMQRWSETYRTIDKAEVERLLGGAAPSGTGTQMSGVGILVEPTERDDLNHLILAPEIIETLLTGIKKIENRDALNSRWGLNLLRPNDGKLALNFYGPPGTGKTMLARAAAKLVGKPLYMVDYASMISKWVGDTGKHIRAAFKEAAAQNAVLFFDEADAMLSKRVTLTDDDVSNSINQNRNILMQELDRFNNIVIFATNLFQNYDPALLRRIAQHVEFTLPAENGRLAILKKKLEVIPAETRESGGVGEIDCDELARESEGFSGSDLENMVANAFEHCGIDKPLTQTVLLTQLDKIAKAKKVHAGKPNKIGIGLSDRKPRLAS